MINAIGSLCLFLGIMGEVCAIVLSVSNQVRADKNEWWAIAYLAIAAYCFK